MINPYENVDWESVQEVCSISHAHAETQAQFDMLYNNGVRHLPLSNYHPSRPWYPLEDQYDSGGNRIFTNIPDDVIQCPNAEHWRTYYFGDTTSRSNNIHMNGLGSTYASDNEESYEAHSNEWGAFCELTENIKRVLNNLIYPDAGGMTLNHPSWSNWYDDRKSLPLSRILRILDLDDRILGIEFYNDTSEKLYGVGWDLDTWDEVLKTGRRAWGFASPDHHHKGHADWQGRNVLLIPQGTSSANMNYECLKAYRSGAFFAKMDNTDLSFTGITVGNGVITVSTNRATEIRKIVDGQSTSYSNDSIQIDIPSATYIRFEASDGSNTIYSNPIIFRPISGENRIIKKVRDRLTLV